MNEIYLAVDGDDVGHQLEYLMLINECKAITKFSKTFQNAMSWLEDKLVNDFSATIIFSGGDNLLAYLNDCPMELIEVLRIEFAERSNRTLSVGLGENPMQAYFALKLAKTSGKNCVRQFKELMNG